MARITLRLFHELRDAVGSGEVQIDAAKLGDVIGWLTEGYPKLRDVLHNKKGDLRTYALFYLNNKHVNPVDPTLQLSDGDVVLVVPPAAGGSPRQNFARPSQPLGIDRRTFKSKG